MLISTSLWSGDLSCMAESLQRVDSYTDFYHFDVMDGHYVRNFLFGPDLIKSLRDKTKRPFEVHLMIEQPGLYLQMFYQAGADILIVHPDVCSDPLTSVDSIKRMGIKAGLALNPEVSLSMVEPILDELDLIVIMGVNPGFRGQSLIPSVISKISQLREILQEKNKNLLIEVDGGIRWEGIPKLSYAGTDVVVAGSIIYKGKSIAENFARLKSL